MNQPSQAQIDLSKKLQAEIGKLLEREAAIAGHILSQGELLLTMIEGCACMLASTCATVAASHPDDDYGATFNRTVQTIAALVMGDRDRAMATIAERRGAAS